MGLLGRMFRRQTAVSQPAKSRPVLRTGEAQQLYYEAQQQKLRLQKAQMEQSLKRERVKLETRSIKRMERRDPETLDTMVLNQAGYRVERPASADPLDAYLTTAARLAQAGLLTTPEAPHGNGMLSDLLTALMAGIGSNPLIAQRLAAIMGPQPAITVTVEPPTLEGRAVENGVPVTDGPPTPQLAPPGSATLKHEDPPVNISALAIAQLAGKTPQDAALFLMSLPDTRARAICGQLCEATDAAIPSVLFALQRQYPETAELIAWLVAERNIEWTLRTVEELRLRAGVAARPAPVTDRPNGTGWG